jgi:hypothetical protein
MISMVREYEAKGNEESEPNSQDGPRKAGLKRKGGAIPSVIQSRLRYLLL